MTPTKAACLGATLLLAAVMARAEMPVPCPPKDPPYPPQSPRIVNPHAWPGVYNGHRAESFVTFISVSGEEITYKDQYKDHHLSLCDQHFHIPVENEQCAAESPPPGCANERQIFDPKKPVPRQWIEVHTVYAANADAKECRSNRLDNDLACCKTGPIVVRGFSAEVTAGDGNVRGGGGADKPLIPPVGRPLAEWSGSNTGPDKPPDSCKPVAAQWSFLLNRGLTVGQRQLKDKKPHGARGVQSDDRLSRDLALVGAGPPCKWVPAGEIRNDEAARAKCPGVCKAPTPRWSGQWYTTWKPTDPNQASNCSCCPAQ